MSKLNIILLVILAGSRILLVASSKKDWNYIMHRFEWNCTNENIVAAPLRPVRISPGVYGLNGTIIIGTPINKDYKVIIKIVRSSSASSQYHMTPFGMPRSSFTTFMNTLYKKLIMRDLQHCSNLPVFDQFRDSLPIGVYYLNSCLVTTDFMPTHMQEGYYKFIYKMEGPLAKFVSELSFQITTVYN